MSPSFISHAHMVTLLVPFISLKYNGKPIRLIVHQILKNMRKVTEYSRTKVNKFYLPQDLPETQQVEVAATGAGTGLRLDSS